MFLVFFLLDLASLYTTLLALRCGVAALKCYGGATYLSSQGVLSITPKKDIYRVKRGKARACSVLPTIKLDFKNSLLPNILLGGSEFFCLQTKMY